ncbi:MAG: ABC transporter substrate-binding protein, partial [Exiguobacterium indicum]
MRKGMLFLLSIICLMSIWIVRNNEQTKQGTAARETVPHLTAYVSAKEDIGRALLSSYCEQAGCTYEFV